MMMMTTSIGKVAVAVAVALVVVSVAVTGSVSAAEDLKGKCSADFEKVMACLSFAQGSSATPSKECCDSMTSIKDKDPKCLCYIMQLTGSGAGAQELKNLGVQMPKLLQLPTVCQLKNANISHCPTILGIPPNSPDAAVFNNVNASATPAAPAAGTGNTSAPVRSGSPTTTANGPRLSAPIMLTAALAFFLQLTLAGKPFPN